VQGVQLPPTNLCELFAALSVRGAGLLPWKQSHRIAENPFFGQPKYLYRFEGLLPQVAGVVREVLPMAAGGHFVLVELNAAKQSLAASHAIKNAPPRRQVGTGHSVRQAFDDRRQAVGGLRALDAVIRHGRTFTRRSNATVNRPRPLVKR